MILTRHATVETDTRSHPVTLPAPMNAQEVCKHFQAIAHDGGRFDVSPVVSIGDDHVARVSFLPAVDTLDGILQALQEV